MKLAWNHFETKMDFQEFIWKLYESKVLGSRYATKYANGLGI